jgi:uncharacterized protein (DUF983 family)
VVELSANFFKSKLKFKPEIINGVCPTCDEDTLLVSLTHEYYRCMTCGTDLEQKVNGVIKYIPTMMVQKETTESDGKEI